MAQSKNRSRRPEKMHVKTIREAPARGRNTPHSALVFGPVGGVHNAINGLVDLLEDEDAG